MVKNLNEFCSAAPRICSIPLSARIPQLSVPQWQLLDANEDFPLIENLVRGHWMPNQQSDLFGHMRVVDEEIATFADAREAKQLRLERATFDYGNGLGVASIYRISTGSCAAELANPGTVHPKKRADGSTILYVGKAADVASGTSPLVDSPFSHTRKTFTGRNLSGTAWTPFLYRLRTYYVDLSLVPDELLVVRPQPVLPEGVGKTLCVIRFNPTPQ